MKKINILEPNITNFSKKLLLKTLKKNEISTSSRDIINKFEKKISSLSGSKYTVSTNTGSSALYVGFKSLGIKKRDLVIMPSYTFIASATSCMLAGGSPWFFDVEKDSFTINLKQIENILKTKAIKKGKHYFHIKTNQRIFAICPVYTIGFLPNLDKIKKIAKKYNLKIIADAACALGGRYNEKKLAHFNDVICYSFNGNKSFTAGGGGAISTNNKSINDQSILVSTNGKARQYFHKTFGLNLRITGLHAAIGLGQLNKFNEVLKRKNKIRDNYINFFKSNKINFFKSHNKKIILWLNFLISKKNLNEKIFINSKKSNINLNYFWMPMHLQPIMRKNLRETCKNTDFIWKKILVLPSSDNLKALEINYIKKFLKKNIKLIKS
jgi:perosamine synthetase